MRKSRGLSLIELIMFIVVLSIFATTSMGAFMTILKLNTKPGSILTASQLANARMNLILLQRKINGIASLADPCSSGSLAACAGIASFASSGGYVITSSITALSGGTRTATVSVTGTNYATIIEEFSQ